MKQFVVADETFLEIWLEQVLSARLQGVFFGGAGGRGGGGRGAGVWIIAEDTL